ncbi:MAG TPA: hypothetical protein VN823_01090 [Stellaceae bacterium]|nr:hypothetical protein [Stellaceae bacterium]
MLPSLGPGGEGLALVALWSSLGGTPGEPERLDLPEYRLAGAERKLGSFRNFNVSDVLSSRRSWALYFNGGRTRKSGKTVFMEPMVPSRALEKGRLPEPMDPTRQGERF